MAQSQKNTKADLLDIEQVDRLKTIVFDLSEFFNQHELDMAIFDLCLEDLMEESTESLTYDKLNRYIHVLCVFRERTELFFEEGAINLKRVHELLATEEPTLVAD